MREWQNFKVNIGFLVVLCRKAKCYVGGAHSQTLFCCHNYWSINSSTPREPLLLVFSVVYGLLKYLTPCSICLNITSSTDLTFLERKNMSWILQHSCPNNLSASTRDVSLSFSRNTQTSGNATVLSKGEGGEGGGGSDAHRRSTDCSIGCARTPYNPYITTLEADPISSSSP